MLSYLMPKPNATTSASGSTGQMTVRIQNRAGSDSDRKLFPIAEAKIACEKIVGIQVDDHSASGFRVRTLNTCQCHWFELLRFNIRYPKFRRSVNSLSLNYSTDPDRIRNLRTVTPALYRRIAALEYIVGLRKARKRKNIKHLPAGDAAGILARGHIEPQHRRVAFLNLGYFIDRICKDVADQPAANFSDTVRKG